MENIQITVSFSQMLCRIEGVIDEITPVILAFNLFTELTVVAKTLFLI